MWFWRCGRRLALVGVILGLSAMAQQLTPELSVRCLSGKYARVNAVLPLVIELRTHDNFRGWLTVTLNDAGDHGGRLLSEALDVGPGRFRFAVPVYPGPRSSDAALTVTLSGARGERLIRREFTDWRLIVPAMPQRRWGRERDEPEVREAGGRLFGWLAARPVEFPLGTFPEAMSWAAVALDPNDLPTDWRLYLGFSTVVLGREAASLIEGPRLDALLDWVRAGGELLVGGDAVPPGLEHAGLANALDLRPASGVSQPLGEDGLPARPLAIGPRPPELLESQVRSYGAGRVIFTSYELGTAAAARPELLNHLRELLLAAAPPAADFWQDQMLPPMPGRGRHHYIPVFWDRELYSWTGLEPISPWVIAAFVVLFVLLATVGERLILRRRNRLTWSWLTTPLLVLVFCLAAGQLSRATRGFQSRRAIAAVHDYGPAGGRRLTVECFVPATTRPVRLAAALPGPPFIAPANVAKVSQDLGGNGFAMSVPVWAPAACFSLTPHREPGPLIAAFQRDPDGRIRGSCESRGDLEISNVGLWDHGHFEYLQREGGRWLARGAAREATFAEAQDRLRKALAAGSPDRWLPPVAGDGVWLLAVFADAPTPVAVDAANIRTVTLHLIRQQLPGLAPHPEP